MTENQAGRRWGIWVAVLSVPVLLTVGGAVLIFSLPSHGYEASAPTTSYVQDTDCRAKNAELALRDFRIERPTSMHATSCLEQERARSYVEFRASGADAGSSVLISVLPAPRAEDEADFDARVAADVSPSDAETVELSRTPYAARGAVLRRRDLQLGEWIVHAVLLPRPHGGGGVILRGQARVGQSATATLRELSRVMTPMIESLRF